MGFECVLCLASLHREFHHYSDHVDRNLIRDAGVHTQSGINLIFGYSQRQHLPEGEEPDNRTRAGTDLVTSLLSRLTLLLDVDIDIAVWSRLIGLILIGSIILANMRNVLASVSRVSSASF